MSTNYPTSLDIFTNPVATSDTNVVSHAQQHQNHNDSITALETKVGVTGSAINTTLDYKTANITSGDRAIGATQTVTVSNKTFSSPKITVGSDAIGDMLYNSSGATGTQSRIAIGSNGQYLSSNGTTPTWVSPTAVNINYIADSGSANAYVATLSPALAAYTAGVLVQFKAANANTTASTLNVNGLGVKTIKKLGGSTDLASGDIATGMIVECEYDGTNFVMLNPVANAPLLPTGDGSGLTNLPQGKLNLVTTDVTYASSTAENTLLSYSVAGGTLSTGNAIRVTMHVSTMTVTNTNTWTLRCKYGATTLVSKIYTAVGTTSLSGKIEFILGAAGTTGTQNGSYALSLAQPNYSGNANTTVQMIGESAQGTSSEDSTTAKTLAITSQHSSSSVNDNITVSLILTEIIR